MIKEINAVLNSTLGPQLRGQWSEDPGGNLAPIKFSFILLFPSNSRLPLKYLCPTMVYFLVAALLHLCVKWSLHN